MHNTKFLAVLTLSKLLNKVCLPKTERGHRTLVFPNQIRPFRTSWR